MGLSPRVFALAGISLVAVLAACGGGSSPTNALPPAVSPSSNPSSAPSSSPSSAPSSSPPSSPSPVPQMWTFAGGAAILSATVGQSPLPVNLVAYQSFSGQIQATIVTSGSGTIAITTALNAGDVSPSTLPVDNAGAGYTPQLYFSFYNGGTQAISFGQNTPAIALTKSGGYGAMTQCELDVYANNGGTGLTWNNRALYGKISGNTATIASQTLPQTNTVNFRPGQSVAALACK